MKLRYLAHSAFQITVNNKVILVDPFLDDNPNSPVKSDDVKADYIILTHGHADHLGDSLKIAKKNKLKFICVKELADYYTEHGFEAHAMHIGGAFDFEFGRVKFTIAHHGSSTPDGRYAGEPAGIILSINGKNIYHAGDTGLFYDLKLIGEMQKIHYMFVPIGDNFTMGIDDAVKAAELVNPEIVIPIHFDTFPVIKADPKEFRQKVEEKNLKCRIMEYGEEIEI